VRRPSDTTKTSNNKPAENIAALKIASPVLPVGDSDRANAREGSGVSGADSGRRQWRVRHSFRSSLDPQASILLIVSAAAFSHCALAAGETVAFLKTLAALPVSSLTKRFTARRDGIDLRLRTLDNLSRQGGILQVLSVLLAVVNSPP